MFRNEVFSYRKKFYEASILPRRERKQRMKKYGHLNLEGDVPKSKEEYIPEYYKRLKNNAAPSE